MRTTPPTPGRVERLSAAELEERWGVRISRRAVTLVNVTAEEAAHLQRYPYVNGPDPSLTGRLWHKLADPDNWRVVERDPTPLDIEVHWSELEITEWTTTLVPATARRVLCAGSQEGIEAAMMRRVRPDREYHALDLLPEHAVRLRRRGLVASVMDIHHLACAPESFDAIYNNNVVEHLYNDVDGCLAEIFAVLKPGGAFVFAMPTEMNSTNPDVERQVQAVGRSHDWWLVDPSHPWKTDLYDIQARLMGVGFERPTFAYFGENLAACAARAQRRGWMWLEAVFRLCRGWLPLHRVEARVRAATGFYRYLSAHRWLRHRLRLPVRQTDTLQVAVVARKGGGPTRASRRDP